MKRILFVCLGNICRSPMAEAIFQSKLEKLHLQGQFMVDSAATSNWEVGSKPHQGTRKILKNHHISYKGIIARQIIQADFEKFDYIIGMDKQNIKDLRSICPVKDQPKIHLFLDIDTKTAGKDVPDPWYTGNFEETYRLVSSGCDEWLTELTK